MSALKFCQTSPSAWIRTEGEDAPGFLQSQFSNDLGKNLEQAVVYGLWLDRKGKVQGDSFVHQAAKETFYLFSYFSTAETILERLNSNIVADDVDLQDETDSVASISWWGDGAGEFLEYLNLDQPPAEKFLSISSGYVISGRRSAHKNFDLIIAKEKSGEVREKINDFGRERSIQWVGAEELQLERILSEIPSVPGDIGPADLPQEGGLEKDAVCFQKGCFLGQEVMARLQYGGTSRRRLYQVRSIGWLELPSLPCELYIGAVSAGQLRSVATSESGLSGLALLKTAQIDETTRFSLSPGGTSDLEIQAIGAK